MCLTETETPFKVSSRSQKNMRTPCGRGGETISEQHRQKKQRIDRVSGLL